MKTAIASIITNNTETIKLTIDGKTYTGVPCTAYLPSLDETEADRRDMVLIDANENNSSEELNATLITEYVENGDALTWDGLNTTTYYEDYETAVAGGRHIFRQETVGD